MNDKSSRIVNYISSLSPDRKPVVVDLDELLRECGDVRSEDIKELALNGYLKLLYSEGGTFCLQVTDKKLPDPVRESAVAPVAPQKIKKGSFGMGFLGGIVGGGLVLALAYAVYFILELF